MVRDETSSSMSRRDMTRVDARSGVTTGWTVSDIQRRASVRAQHAVLALLRLAARAPRCGARRPVAVVGVDEVHGDSAEQVRRAAQPSTRVTEGDVQARVPSGATCQTMSEAFSASSR